MHVHKGRKKIIFKAVPGFGCHQRPCCKWSLPSVCSPRGAAMLQPHMTAKVTGTSCWCPRRTKSSGTPGLWEEGEKELSSSKLGEGGEERQPLCLGCGNCSETSAESATQPLQLLPCGGKRQVGSRPPRRDPGPGRCSPPDRQQQSTDQYLGSKSSGRLRACLQLSARARRHHWNENIAPQCFPSLFSTSLGCITINRGSRSCSHQDP